MSFSTSNSRLGTFVDSDVNDLDLGPGDPLERLEAYARQTGFTVTKHTVVYATSMLVTITAVLPNGSEITDQNLFKTNDREMAVVSGAYHFLQKIGFYEGEDPAGGELNQAGKILSSVIQAASHHLRLEMGRPPRRPDSPDP